MVKHHHKHGKKGGPAGTMDSVHRGKHGTKGKAVGVRPIRPAAVKVTHHAPLGDAKKTRKSLHKIYI